MVWVRSLDPQVRAERTSASVLRQTHTGHRELIEQRVGKVVESSRRDKDEGTVKGSVKPLPSPRRQSSFNEMSSKIRRHPHEFLVDP